MKSEHRHELQTNELSEWIANFPDYVRKNIRTILGILLIAAGIGYYFFNKNVRGKAVFKEEAATTELIESLGQNKAQVLQSQRTSGFADTGSFLVTSNSLEKAANEAKNPLMSALAYVKRAEGLRMELHYRSGEIKQEDIAVQVEQAKRAYEKALEKAESSTETGLSQIIGMAWFGLGLCAEEVGNFDEASKIYETIAANSDFEGTVYPARAKFRLVTMQDSQDKFVFAKAPVVETTVPDAGTIDIELPGGVDAGGKVEIETIDIQPQTDESGETE